MPDQKTVLDQIRAYYQENAKKPQAQKDDCITALNHALPLYLGRNDIKLGSRIDQTMEILEAHGLCSPRHDIEFLSHDDEPTTGQKIPMELQKNIGKTCDEMISYYAENSNGKHVFALSVMDGYHAIYLLYTRGTISYFHWGDNWKHAHLECLDINGGNTQFGGWKELSPAQLDWVVEELTRTWWSIEKDPKKKPRTRTTLWYVPFPEPEGK